MSKVLCVKFPYISANIVTPNSKAVGQTEAELAIYIYIYIYIYIVEVNKFDSRLIYVAPFVVQSYTQPIV